MTAIWKKEPTRGDTPTIFVTKSGLISVVVDGHQITMRVEKWHILGRLRAALEELLED